MIALGVSRADEPIECNKVDYFYGTVTGDAERHLWDMFPRVII